MQNPLKKGRPRGFDEDAALEAALRVFWENSYEGATLADLTAAMGINRSSMYATFGDKEALFRRVIGRYRAGQMGYFREALAAPTAHAAIRALLTMTVAFLAEPGHPKGCLTITGALACGPEAEAIKKAMVDARRQAEAAIRKRFARAQHDGDLASGIDPAGLARYVASLLAGLGVQAANGATKAEMRRVVELALRFLTPAAIGSSESQGVPQ
ncbi:MAG TPA: TetR/AcrR family transcriptional regulator [Bryobacteraceae bacterium]|nr:TetR/AcrR family transcriptional regulator [Bryobacteraceae bacterium]